MVRTKAGCYRAAQAVALRMHAQIPQLQRHGPALMPVQLLEDWVMHESYAKIVAEQG